MKSAYGLHLRGVKGNKEKLTKLLKQDELAYLRLKNMEI